jgi:nicotinamide riboside kinase
MNQKQYKLNMAKKKKLPKTIGITGGENSGKTSLSPYLFEHLPKYGIKPFMVGEAASTLFSGGVNPLETSNLQRVIIEKILSDERIFKKAATGYTGNLKPVVFCDRGVLDCKVFCKPGEFEKILRQLGTNEHAVKESYDGIIHLVTTAEGKEDVFLATFKDNNVRQPMTAEEARTRDKKLQQVYLGSKKMSIIPNDSTFEMKKRNALKAILSHLGIPIPQEIEYKF